MPEAHISFHGNELQAKKDQVSDGCGFIPGGVRDLGKNHARFAMFALHESENGPRLTTCALQQVGSYLGYTGHQIKPCRHPKQTDLTDPRR
jgi:hypothetical protein